MVPAALGAVEGPPRPAGPALPRPILRPARRADGVPRAPSEAREGRRSGPRAGAHASTHAWGPTRSGKPAGSNPQPVCSRGEGIENNSVDPRPNPWQIPPSKVKRKSLSNPG